GASLLVNAPGYEAKFVAASVELKEIVMTANSKIKVGYQSMDRNNLIGGVSYVNMPEIMEKNFITYSLGNMEAFAGGFHGSLWGMNDVLILVDGVPRDGTSVMRTEVEQVTFLKSAPALALYGSRAAKGVILITTKRGTAGSRVVNVRANTGVLVPRRFPKYLGSAEYMTLYNEARVNDGLSELYSDEDIYNHASGNNPYRYPDVGYYSPKYLKDYYHRHDATVEITGGRDRTKYYTNIGFWRAGSLLTFGQAVNNSNERVSVRGNVDMKLNRFLTAYVDAAAIYYSGKGVNTNYWEGAATLRPHRFAPLLPISMIEESDETSLNYVRGTQNLIGGQYLLGGTQLDQTSPI